MGNYLGALAADPHARSAIDLDWLTDRAIGREPTRLTSAGQVHALRALATYKVDRDRGNQVHSFAWDQLRTRHMTVGAWATRAWAASGAWTPKATAHIIEVVDHQGYRRAAVSGFTRVPSATAATHLAPMVRLHPELRPVATLVTN